MSGAPARGHQAIDTAGRLGQLGQLLPVGAVPLHVGFGPVPPGHRAVDAWRAAPTPGDPRYLVPVGHAPARRVLVSHLRLRESRVRLQRRAAAAAVAPLAAWYRDRAVLRVSVPSDVGDDVVDALFVTRHLVGLVPAATGTALSLRGGHARAKPMVQLVDDRGEVVAFAKVAADPATAARVRREAALLRRFGDALGTAGPLRLPRVLAAGEVADFTYSVVEPLPQQVRGGREGDLERALPGLVALCDGVGVLSAPLGTATLWTDTLEALEDVLTGGTGDTVGDGARELADAAAALATRMSATDAGVVLPLGPFHGDWVPWNLGWVGSTQWAWDLEYGSVEGPVGLDALRWVFLVEQLARGRALPAAVASMRAAAPGLLRRLGANPAHTDLLVRMHLLELVTSALAVLAAGRGMPLGLEGAPEVLREAAR
jgi:hypothetical protein